MSYIDWNIAKPSKHGKRISTHAKVFYRDEKSGNKSVNYNISIYVQNAPKEITGADFVSVGSDGDNVYLSVNQNSRTKFKLYKGSGNNRTTYFINGKDLIVTVFEILTGITPSGAMSASFNFEKIGSEIYKIVDFKIL